MKDVIILRRQISQTVDLVKQPTKSGRRTVNRVPNWCSNTTVNVVLL